MLYIRGRQVIVGICIAFIVLLGFLAAGKLDKATDIYIDIQSGIEAECKTSLVKFWGGNYGVNTIDEADIEVVLTTSLDKEFNGDGYSKYLIGYSGANIVYSDKYFFNHPIIDLGYSMKDNIMDIGKLVYEYTINDIDWCSDSDGNALQFYIPDTNSLEYKIVIENIKYWMEINGDSDDTVDSLVDGFLSRCKYITDYSNLEAIVDRNMVVLLVPSYMIKENSELSSGYEVWSSDSGKVALLYAYIKPLNNEISLSNIENQLLTKYNSNFNTIKSGAWKNYDTFMVGNIITNSSSVVDESGG